MSKLYCKKKYTLKPKKPNLFQKISLIFWKIGLLNVNECPFCSRKLLKTGFPDELTGEQYYKCIKDNCLFNEPNKRGKK